MRFFADQDVYAITIQRLRRLGHDVLTAAEVGLSRAPDTQLLQRANAENRIFLTRDKDYGGLVFVGHLGRGVILLRMKPSTFAAVHLELERVLTLYDDEELRSAFVVVEPGVHRFRKLT